MAAPRSLKGFSLLEMLVAVQAEEIFDPENLFRPFKAKQF